ERPGQIVVHNSADALRLDQDRVYWITKLDQEADIRGLRRVVAVDEDRDVSEPLLRVEVQGCRMQGNVIHARVGRSIDGHDVDTNRARARVDDADVEGKWRSSAASAVQPAQIVDGDGSVIVQNRSGTLTVAKRAVDRAREID